MWGLSLDSRPPAAVTIHSGTDCLGAGVEVTVRTQWAQVGDGPQHPDVVTDLTGLADALRALRRRHARRGGVASVTYRDLAADTGWSLGAIAGYFSGRILPPTDRFDILVRRLGANPAEQGALATARDRVDDARRCGARPTDAVRPAPVQLPADVPAFTGRIAALRRLDGDGWRVAVLTGSPGIGKTALAVHWAHAAQSRFPDGQLFVNLRGHAAELPLSPIAALGQLLRALGVAADDVPADRDEAAARYRSLLTDARLLVLLDNAHSAQQVRPLLPGAGQCLVLVTSRNPLVGLAAREGAQSICLDVLTEAEAEALLLAMLGAGRLAEEPGATAALGAACAYLPLALRIAAGNLAARPGLRLATYLDRLRDNRLSALEVDADPDAAVRGAFDLSYRALPAPAQRVFRLLGLVPGPDVPVAAVADLAGPEAGDALRLLGDAHLVTEPRPGRYALHDLLHLYARERAGADESPADLAADQLRLFDWYERHAYGAAVALHPERLRLPARRPPAPFADRPAALTWLDAERTALLSIVPSAVPGAAPQVAWAITDALRGYASQRLPSAAWAQLLAAGLAAADQPRPRAAMLLGRAELERRLGRYDTAIDSYEQAAALAQTAGWADGEAAALGNLATVCRYRGRLHEAVAHYGRSLDLDRHSGRTAGLANTMGSLGIACRELGELDHSVQHLRHALTLFRAAGSASGSAVALDNLGETYLALGRPVESLRCSREALRLARAAGDQANEAILLRGLAAAYAALGRLAPAEGVIARALVLSGETVDRQARLEIQLTAAGIATRAGRPAEALPHLEDVRRLAGASGHRYPEAAALVGLAETHRHLGEPDLARWWARRATDTADACGYRLLVARAETMLTIHAIPSAVPS
jgi:tetratricopeptide (TPR) repeat protein